MTFSILNRHAGTLLKQMRASRGTSTGDPSWQSKTWEERLQQETVLPWLCPTGPAPVAQPLCALPRGPPPETHRNRTDGWCRSLPNPGEKSVYFKNRSNVWCLHAKRLIKVGSLLPCAINSWKVGNRIHIAATHLEKKKKKPQGTGPYRVIIPSQSSYSKH